MTDMCLRSLSPISIRTAVLLTLYEEGSATNVEVFGCLEERLDEGAPEVTSVLNAIHHLRRRDWVGYGIDKEVQMANRMKMPYTLTEEGKEEAERVLAILKRFVEGE